MGNHDTAVAIAAIENTGNRHALHVRLRGGEEREWQLPEGKSRSGVGTVIDEFATVCGEAAIVCYEAEKLRQLLSRDDAPQSAEQLLENLRDLRQLAVIFLPLERDPAGEEGSAPPQAKNGREAIDRTEQLLGRVLAKVRDTPPRLLSLLKPLLAGETTFSWLEWPSGGSGLSSTGALNSVLPGQMPSRRRHSPDENAFDDIAQAAVDMLSTNGLIDRLHDAYEYRDGQVDMAREVADAFCREQYLVVEAGTGVGKSLAYLIPAILWSRREGEPVVISTNTKNLQQQLIAKDIPLLQRGFAVDFDAVLLKGRANYACIRRLSNLLTEVANTLVTEDRLAAAYLVSWAASCQSGDLSTIPQIAYDTFSELEHSVRSIRSESGACPGRKCSHYQFCPIQIARARARNADIVVSNHALTLEDTRGQILPEYSRLIFDEAQNVEDVATSSLSLECSSYGVRQLMRTLAEEPSGLLAQMEVRLEQSEGGAEVAELKKAGEAIGPAAEQFYESAQTFGEHLHEMAAALSRDPKGSQNRARIRFTERVTETDEWDVVRNVGQATAKNATQLLEGLEHLAGLLGEADDSLLQQLRGLDADVETVRTEVADQLQALSAVLGDQPEGVKFVTWAEAWTTSYGIAWSVNAAPVDVGPVLQKALYEDKKSIVFTSATMTVSDRFDYFRQRLGLDAENDRLVEATVPSPFDLTSQLLFCIPADISEPGSGEYVEAVVEALGQICDATAGGTLALFTARKRMDRAFNELAPQLRENGMTPLCQYVSGERSELLERMKADRTAVLFGLKSYWEGVDVPGEALRCVVICKLPFAVPTDPIIEARQEDVAEKGLNPMSDYYIPQAVIGFKQGFGRLIRNTTDTGAVFVLDRRLLTKPYGRRFFQSIQRCELCRRPLEECVDRTDAWLGTM